SLNRQALSQALVGEPVRVVGYGISAAATHEGAGIKRQTFTQLSVIRDNVFEVGDSRHGTCNGDSGGPALMAGRGNEVIVSGTSFRNASCEGGGYEARVDTDLTFVDEYLSRSCTPACSGRSCGNDGCGGSCGECEAGATCTSTGRCTGQPASCTEQEPNDSPL